MPLFRPSELLSFLEEKGAAPKKSLSQNFLIDGNILQKILKAADIKPGDVVFEIGPGPGALTEALVEAGAKVIACEKDDKFAEALKRFEGVEVYNGDVRDFPFETLAGASKVKVVSNLPYHLTTPILALLIPRNDLFSTITVMVQEEVARRMTSKKGSKDYSSLSVFLSFFSDPKYQFKVSPKSFFPAPRVFSAVVTLTLKTPPQVKSQEEFFQLVRGAFGQRRKMVRGSLRKIYSEEVIERALGASKVRPEDLSLEEFLNLYKTLTSS